MNIERVARTVLGVAALCGLFVSAGCNGALSSNNSGGQPSGGTPIPSVKAPGDWGRPMLAGGGVGVGMVPAKFTWDVNAAPSCANDYVAYNTSLAGVSPTTAASRTGTFGPAQPTNGQTATITSPGTSITLTASTTLNTGLNFLIGATPTATATNFVAAINRNNTANLGVTASNVGGTSATVTLSASANGAEGNLITLAEGLAGFAWAGGATTLAGGVGTGNIVAFNQLYSTQGSATGLCPQDGPSVMWSYFTGTGTAVTSIVLSGDGSKVAFAENVAGAATLRILKWKAGEGTGTGYPATPATTLTAGQNWTTDCPAANSCMSSIAFTGGFADTKSSPFYVYTNNADVLYAGDNNGRVHKFTGVFNGTPAEVISGWPKTINGATILTSPVYDSVSGNIFVGDSTGLLSMIRETGSTAGTCTPLPCVEPIHLAVGTGGAIVDAPIVDGTTGTVIAVNGTETSANNGTVLQASTALTGAVSFKIGGTTPGGSALYSGAFDNTYITSAKPTIAGHMYVCGKDPSNADEPAIYQLSFTALTGVLSGVGSPLVGMVNGNGEACSPVTEIFNSTAATDRIFFSIGNNLASGGGNPLTACRSNGIGCVASIVVTGSPAWPGGATVFNALPTPLNATGATSGIVVDNVSASAQASSFYFSLGANSTGAGPGLPSCNTTAGVGCAVKLTQSALN